MKGWGSHSEFEGCSATRVGVTRPDEFGFARFWKNTIKSFNVLTTTNSNSIKGFIENCNQVGLSPKIYEFKPIKGKNDGNDCQNNCTPSQACLEIFRSKSKCCNGICQEIAKNHKIIIADAYNSNLENVMIFEDDARFVLPFDFKKLERVLNFLESRSDSVNCGRNSHWDVFYFGHCPAIPLGYPVNRDIVRTFYPGLFHAYILNRKAMEFVLNIPNDNYIDLVVGRNQSLKKYAVFPSMNYQEVGPSIYTSLKISKCINFNTVNYIFEIIQYYLLIFILIVFLFFLIS